MIEAGDDVDLVFGGDPAQRRLWGEMRAYVRGLPALLSAPLPTVLAAQTPAAEHCGGGIANAIVSVSPVALASRIA